MQVDKTMELLLSKYLKATIRYEGIQRVESYPMPASALREAVLNAIIHRDYAVPSPIQIRVHADRLLIWNPGELPDHWSSEMLLRQHPSKPFNPSVANAFFRAGEIEAWGRGIQRVFEACREEGTPEPRIRVEPGDLWFELPFSEAYLASVSTELPEGTTQETRGKTREKTREKVLRLIRRQPSITTRELAEEIGITAKGIEWQLGKLKAGGVLRRVGSDKGGHWEVLEDRHE